MADAVYSSMALPGIYPPIPTVNGRLLVDGGVMDNLPVETMARRAEGPIIAVDVSQRLSGAPSAARPGLERLARRTRRLLTGHERPMPPLRETIHWTIALGSNDTVAAGMRHADLVISPRVEGIGILEWKQLPRALEIGRQAAREALQRGAATDRLVAALASQRRLCHRVRRGPLIIAPQARTGAYDAAVAITVPEIDWFNPRILQRQLDGTYTEVRERVREVLSRPEFAPAIALPTADYRERVLEWCNDVRTRGPHDVRVPEGLRR